MKRLILVAAAIVIAVTFCASEAWAAPSKQRAKALRILDRVERPLILGGLPAAPGTFGMMAFVAYEDPDTGDISVCSGTVVSARLVLTAGHCALDPETGVADQAAGYAVATGSLDWTSPARQVSAVTRTIIDPLYNPGTDDGDAALLVLSTPTTAAAVPLASDPGDLSLMHPGSPAQIAGWGLTLAGTIPNQLQWGVSAVQSAAYCTTEAGYGGMSFDLGRQMCAIDAPTYVDGTCSGDSGGPLLAQRSDGTWVELGITNWGAANCSTGVPDFFARADSISSWVTGWIQALAAPSPAGPPVAPVGTPPPPVTPPPAPAPPAVSPRPLAGLYRGRTSQRWPITLQVAASRTALSSLSFSFSLSCTRHRRVSYSISPGRGHITWRLKQDHGLGFDDTFSDSTGEHYEVKGNFDSSGSAAGFITTTWRSRRFGTCRSGLLTWGARDA
jgi:secreted trypsin-like serine protease